MRGLRSSEVIQLLKKGDRRVLEDIYVSNRHAFYNFAMKMGFSEQEALDAYQESIIVLWENVVTGKVQELKSAVSTYLFAIGKNKLAYFRKKQSKLYFNVEDVLLKKKYEIDVNFSEQKVTNKKRLIQKALRRLSERCVEILKMFYLEGLDLDEIIQVLDFKNKASLRSQKSRCINKLKEIIKQYGS